MSTSRFRVLVIDDYEPWRSFASRTLREMPELQLVGEASDGLEAVKKVLELQPDLILLDVELPNINGLEVARRTRTLSPNSKILVTTQESSVDVLEQVLSIGASGYLVKADAGRELIPAITAVLRGERFLGSRFAGLNLSVPSSLRTHDAFPRYEYPASEPIPIPKTGITYRHEVHFFSNDDSLVNGLTRCTRTALNSGSAVIVFASELHRNTVISKMQVHGIDMNAALDQRRYIPLDAVDILSKFMVGDLPDPIRLFKVLNDVIETVPSHREPAHTRAVTCGGLAPVLLSQGKPEAAIRLEQLWNEVVQSYRLDTVCMYSHNIFESEQDTDVFQRICELHSSVHR